MIVTYNNYVFPTCTIERWSQRQVYDESMTNLLWTEHDLTIQFYMTQTAGDLMAADFNTLRNTLMIPRKMLRIQVPETSYLVEITASVGDIHKGPQPQELTPIRFFGNLCIKCQWRVVFRTVECYDTQEGVFDPHDHIALMKTFQCSYLIDGEGLQTRVFTGTVQCRDGQMDGARDYDITALSAERVRGLVPPMISGFQRQSVSIDLSSDGLRMTVKTIDKETFFGSVLGVASIKAQLREGIRRSTQGVDPEHLHRKSMDITVVGTKGTKRSYIRTEIIPKIIAYYFNLAPPSNPADPQSSTDETNLTTEQQKQGMVMDIIWQEDIASNTVSCSISTIELNNALLWAGFSGANLSGFLSDGWKHDGLPPDIIDNRANVNGIQVSGDAVTWDVLNGTTNVQNRNRLADLLAPARVLLDNVCSGAAATSQPSAMTTAQKADDLSFSIFGNVSVTVDGGDANPQNPAQHPVFKPTAGVVDGGYVMDQEWLAVERINESVLFASTQPGSGGTRGSQKVHQNRLPVLWIRQAGVAWRVNGKPVPRKRILFTPDDRIRGRTRGHRVYALPTKLVGSSILHGVVWRYEYEVLGDPADFEDLDDGQVRRKVAEISARNGRVLQAVVENVSGSVGTFDMTDPAFQPSP
jgi:hypothetical protein